MQAHNELLRVMDAADADVGASDEESRRSKARETIRKLEALGPRLADATDRGNALLYAGMSHATLGENQKACASVKRAQSFAGQSQALRNNIDQWQELLSCPK